MCCRGSPSNWSYDFTLWGKSKKKIPEGGSGKKLYTRRIQYYKKLIVERFNTTIGTFFGENFKDMWMHKQIKNVRLRHRGTNRWRKIFHLVPKHTLFSTAKQQRQYSINLHALIKCLIAAYKHHSLHVMWVPSVTDTWLSQSHLKKALKLFIFRGWKWKWELQIFFNNFFFVRVFYLTPIFISILHNRNSHLLPEADI